MYVLGTVCCQHIHQCRIRRWAHSVMCVQSKRDHQVLRFAETHLDVRMIAGRRPELSGGSLLLPVLVELGISHDGDGLAFVPQGKSSAT